MIESLQIGTETFSAEAVLPLLVQHQLIPHLRREVIIDRALAEIECSDEEKIQAMQAFCERNQLASDEHKQAWLAYHAMAPEHLETLALRELKLQKFKRQTWENQINSDFLEHKQRFDRLIYSLIRTQDVGLAQELYFRIQDDPDSFSQLAQTYSEGVEAERGGLLGPVTLDVPHPNLAKLLSISQPGQLHPPMRIGEWFVVVRLEKFLPAQLDDNIRQRLLEMRFQTWLKAELQNNPIQLK
ncbi:MAG: peptidylprolyl isomerase [Leptolyngbya sp. RL_3_1]|nr:peptidylprolyl isomerase [Leptolyngbya sp. RL_3_1]